jgi:inosose dehydratase
MSDQAESAKTPTAATPRTTVTLAGAPDSWGVWFPDNPKQPHWSRFLDEVSEAGYRFTELGPWGYLPTDFVTLGQELDKRGLGLVGVTCIAPLEDASQWEAIEKDVRAQAKLAKHFAVKYLVLIDAPYADLFTGEPVAEKELGDEAWGRLVETTTRIGRWIRDEWDLQLVFHPHAETHVETPEQIERLLEDTPSETVGLCLDTGHHAYMNGEPISFIRDHAARIPYLHVKDVDHDKRRKVLDEGITFADAVATGTFVEAGHGTIDFSELRRTLDEIGFEGWAVVEQDMYPAPLDAPLPIARRTYRHLVEAGFTG